MLRWLAQMREERQVKLVVLVCQATCLALVAIALATPEWLTTRRPGAPPHLDRVDRVGLQRYSSLGECASRECRVAWRTDESEATSTCRGSGGRLPIFFPPALASSRSTSGEGSEDSSSSEGSVPIFPDFSATGPSDCDYYRKGYCMCNYNLDKVYRSYRSQIGSVVGCNSTEPDLAEEDRLYYYEAMQRTWKGARYSLAATILCLSCFLWVVLLNFLIWNDYYFRSRWPDWHQKKKRPDSVLYSSLPPFIPLVVALVMGTRFTRLYLLARYCGSHNAWEREDAEMPKGYQLEVNWFGTGPVLCLMGCVCLALPWVFWAWLCLRPCISRCCRGGGGGGEEVEPRTPLTAPGGVVAIEMEEGRGDSRGGQGNQQSEVTFRLYIPDTLAPQQPDGWTSEAHPLPLPLAPSAAPPAPSNGAGVGGSQLDPTVLLLQNQLLQLQVEQLQGHELPRRVVSPDSPPGTPPLYQQRSSDHPNLLIGSPCTGGLQREAEGGTLHQVDEEGEGRATQKEAGGLPPPASSPAARDEGAPAAHSPASSEIGG